MLTLMLETAMLILVQSLGRGVVPFQCLEIFQGSMKRQYDLNLNKGQGRERKYFFFIFVAAPKGVQGYVFIGLNQFTYHHRSNRSRWPGLVQLGAPPSPRLESQLLAVRGGRGVVVKMEAL